jgi:hypothetical protein
MVSFEHHIANLDHDKFAASFAARGRLEELESSPPPIPPDPDPVANYRMFIEHDGSGMVAPTLATVLHHLDTAWQRRQQPNVAMFHYADYQADLVGEMERLAAALDLTFSRERLAELAPAASLDRMRERAAQVAPEAGIYVDDRAFFRTGGSGEWVGRGTDLDHHRYAERVKELAPPDLADWTHRGRIASHIDPNA